MKLYPAIDLRQGKVVRLLQGLKTHITAYSDDPCLVARGFIDSGATWIHVVNLDGAFADVSGDANKAALSALLMMTSKTSTSVQVGGGLRSLEDLDALFSLGAARAIIGSAAVDNPSLVRDAVQRFGGSRITVGIDAKGGVTDGEVMTRGWTRRGARAPVDLGLEMVAIGVERFIYTDIDRDGMQLGPDAEGAARLACETGADVIISGGVGTLDHLNAAYTHHNAASPGLLDGVIVGKALYENRFSVADAINTLAAPIAS